MFFFPEITKQTISLFRGTEIDDLMSKPVGDGSQAFNARARMHPEDLEDLAERDPCAVRRVLTEAGVDPTFADVSGTAGGWPEV